MKMVITREFDESIVFAESLPKQVSFLLLEAIVQLLLHSLE